MTTVFKKRQKVFADFSALHGSVGVPPALSIADITSKIFKSLNNNIPGKAARSNEADQLFPWFFSMALEKLRDSFELDFLRIMLFQQII